MSNVSSKWIKDLHVKADTLKLIAKKLGKTLEDMGTGEKFLNRYVPNTRAPSFIRNIIKAQSTHCT